MHATMEATMRHAESAIPAACKVGSSAVAALLPQPPPPEASVGDKEDTPASSWQGFSGFPATLSEAKEATGVVDEGEDGSPINSEQESGNSS